MYRNSQLLSSVKPLLLFLIDKPVYFMKGLPLCLMVQPSYLGVRTMSRNSQTNEPPATNKTVSMSRFFPT